MTDPQAIAARLSEAQKRAIHDAREMYRGEFIIHGDVRASTCEALDRLGLVARSAAFPGHFCLNSDGIAVRSILGESNE